MVTSAHPFESRIIRHADRAEWDADRFTSVGASESPALLAMEVEIDDGTVFSSPYSLWCQKRKLIPAPDLSDNDAVQSGRHLEVGILNWYREKRKGLHSLQPWDQTARVHHPRLKFWRCTPDALAYQSYDGGEPELTVVNAKNVSEWMKSRWLDNAGGYIPYQVQLQCEMAILGIKRGTLAVNIGGQKLVWFDHTLDEKFAANMERVVTDFWKLVEEDKAPSIDGTQYTADALSERYRQYAKAKIAPLKMEHLKAVRDLEEVQAELAKLQTKELLLENQLKAAVAENGAGQLPNGWLVSWFADAGGKRRLRIKKKK